jgi:hypothetical protein
MRHSSTPLWSNPDAWKNAMLAKAERMAAREASRPAFSSMLRLASTAMELHKATLAKGLIIDGEVSPPLALAATALQAAVRIDKGELP